MEVNPLFTWNLLNCDTRFQPNVNKNKGEESVSFLRFNKKKYLKFTVFNFLFISNFTQDNRFAQFYSFLLFLTFYLPFFLFKQGRHLLPKGLFLLFFGIFWNKGLLPSNCLYFKIGNVIHLHLRHIDTIFLSKILYEQDPNICKICIILRLF